MAWIHVLLKRKVFDNVFNTMGKMNNNIEEQIASKLSEEIAKEIDFGILSEMMVMAGWTKYSLPRYLDNKHAIDIRMWVEDNISKNNYRQCGRTWLFKQAKDATMFILRWSSE